MTHVSWTRALAIAAIAGAAGIVLLPRSPPALAPATSGTAAPAEDLQPPQDTSRAVATALPEAPAAATLRELNAMSETFRNTTFLIEIRSQGFVCEELLGVYGGANDSATWTATCSAMLAYTVGVTGSGELHVEPLLQYLDGVPRVPPAESGREPLPPRNR
jgi:hypothetical protein